jgi:hypothetical protein
MICLGILEFYLWMSVAGASGAVAYFLTDAVSEHVRNRAWLDAWASQLGTCRRKFESNVSLRERLLVQHACGRIGR